MALDTIHADSARALLGVGEGATDSDVAARAQAIIGELEVRIAEAPSPEFADKLRRRLADIAVARDLLLRRLPDFVAPTAPDLAGPVGEEPERAPASPTEEPRPPENESPSQESGFVGRIRGMLQSRRARLACAAVAALVVISYLMQGDDGRGLPVKPAGQTGPSRPGDFKPDSPYAYAFAAATLERDPREALEMYKQLSELHPTDARAVYGMATAYESVRDYRGAVRSWRRYLWFALSKKNRAAAEQILAYVQEQCRAQFGPVEDCR